MLLIIKKDILLFGKGPMQRLDDTILTAEAEYSINFNEWGKKFCLSLHYTESSIYLFVTLLVINLFICYQVQAKDSKWNTYPVCLENISKDASNDSTKNTGLNWYVYDFSVDFGSIVVGNILDIHKYLIK